MPVSITRLGRLFTSGREGGWPDSSPVISIHIGRAPQSSIRRCRQYFAMPRDLSLSDIDQQNATHEVEGSPPRQSIIVTESASLRDDDFATPLPRRQGRRGRLRRHSDGDMIDDAARLACALAVKLANIITRATRPTPVDIRSGPQVGYRFS